VILPMYDEPYEVVRESFASLTRVNYDPKKLLVVLALEDRAGDAARATGAKLQHEFGASFGKFLVTHHPAGLPDEIPGKGSNEVWAGEQAKREMDAKTAASQRYPAGARARVGVRHRHAGLPGIFQPAHVRVFEGGEAHACDLSADPAVHEQRVRGADARARRRVLDDVLADDAAIAAGAADVVLVAIDPAQHPARHRLVG
jgi:hypothetical protein